MSLSGIGATSNSSSKAHSFAYTLRSKSSNTFYHPKRRSELRETKKGRYRNTDPLNMIVVVN